MRRLQDYVEDCKRLGPRAFQLACQGPVLIGLGARGGTAAIGSKRRAVTLDVDDDQTEETHTGLLGRVWIIEKAERTSNPDSRPSSTSLAVTVGRDPDNDIVIPDSTISTRHCQFRIEPGRWRLSDLGSLNGTAIDGDRLGQGQQLPITSGTRISMGRLEFEFLSIQAFVQLVTELGGSQPRRRTSQ